MKNFTHFLLFLALVLTSISGLTQDKKSVVIGSMVSKPNAILILNPTNGDQGFLLPQMSSASRISMQPSSPLEDGLIVYDLTDKSFYFWKDNQWVKGLGSSNTNSSLTFDPATNTLSLGNGNTADLTPLKEIPDPAGQAGKYITTDGTTLTWATISNLGDITGIITGAGLSGGVTSGNASLAVNTDNTSISINGANQLQITDNGVTPTKIFPGATNTFLSTNNSGEVGWVNAPADNQNLSLTGNTLSISNGTTPVNLNAAGEVTGPINNLTLSPAAGNSVVNAINNTSTSGKVNTNRLATEVVLDTDAPAASGDVIGDFSTGLQIKPNAVSPSKLSPSTTNGQVLTTLGGVTTWANPAASTDNQNINLAGNILTIESGNTADLTALNASGEVNGSLNNLVIANDAVTTTKILDGTIAVNDLGSLSVTDAKIAPGITASKLNPSVTNGQVLTTLAGVTTWANASASTDDQNINLAGNILSIESGNTADLATLNASGEVNGSLNNLVIANDAVTTTKILDGTIVAADLANLSVTSTKLQSDALVDANRAVTTDHIKDNAITTSKINDASVTSAKLTTSGVVLGTYGTATEVSQITVDAQGRITNATNVTITGAAPTGAAGGDLIGNFPNPSITANAVTSAKILDGTIVTADLSNLSVTSAKLQSDALADANRAVTTDHIKDNSITTSKINDASVTSAKLTTSGVVLGTYGTATEVSQITVDAQGRITNATNVTITGAAPTGAAGGDLIGNFPNPAITANAVTSAKILDGTIAAADLASDAVTSVKIFDGAVTDTKIASGVAVTKLVPGANGQVLSTSAGIPVWITPASGGSVTAVTAGTGLDGGTINTTGIISISIGGVNTAQLADAGVTSAKILDGAITTTDLANLSVTSLKLQSDASVNVNRAVTTDHIRANAITTSKIAPGSNNTLLATDGTGNVNWIAAPVVTDNQQLTFSGNTLSLTNDATPVDLVAGGEVSGDLDNLTIGLGSVDATNMSPGNYSSVITSGSYPINITGTATSSTNFLGSLTGDVTGTQSATIVSKIQGNNVSAVTPLTNQVLKFNGTQWEPQTDFGTSGTVTSITAGTGLIASPANPITTSGTIGINTNGVTANELSSSTTTNTDRAVTTDHIRDAAVTTAKINNGAITDVKITNVSPSKLTAASALTGQVLKYDGTKWIPQDDLVNAGTVTSISTSGGLIGGTITGIGNISIDDGGVTTAKIADASITSIKISDNSITGADIFNGTITTAELGNSAVTSAKLANTTVTPGLYGTDTEVAQISVDAQGRLTNASNVTIVSAGDVIGPISATTVAKIQGIDVSTTDPTDQQVLQYDLATTQWKPVTLPSLLSAFKVQQTNTQIVSGTTQISWNNELYDDGSNLASNVFTAPSDGLYHFDVVVTINNVDKDERIQIILRVGGTDIQKNYGYSGKNGGDTNAAISTDVKLTTGNQVRVFIAVLSGYSTEGDGASTQFSGRKIY